VTASGGPSGNAVTFSIDAASTAGACSISAANVSFTGAGACVIDANQAGDANYTAAPQAQQPLTIASAAKTPQANALAFSVDPSSAAGACSISGSAVSFTGVGSCVIDANQAGDASYLAAPQV